tara:strand:- start:272 stop:619 length:348 start_codon:yes stop_codon:yes gene_type:complete
MGDSWNLVLLKWLVLLGSMPIWLPFAKALWSEFMLAMRPEGGLFGPIPSPVERKRIEEEMLREEPRQIHETLAHARQTKFGGRSAAGKAEAAPTQRGASRAGPQSGGQRKPFSSR